MDVKGTSALYPVGDNQFVSCPLRYELGLRRLHLEDGRWQTGTDTFGTPAHTSTISADGRWLFRLTGEKPGEYQLEGWQLHGDPVRKWSQPFETSTSVGGGGTAFSQSSARGNVFALSIPRDSGGEVVVYRNSDNKATQAGTIPVNHSGRYRFALSSDGSRIVHCEGGGPLILLDTNTAPLTEVARTNNPGESVTWFSFSPDGKWIACAANTGYGSGLVLVLDAQTLKTVYERKFPGAPSWIEFAPDGRHLLTLNGNRTVYVLRLTRLFERLGKPRKEVRAFVGADWLDLNRLDEDWILDNGDWFREDGRWSSAILTPAVMGLPLTANGSYDLEAELSLDAGGDLVGLQLPVGKRVVGFVFNGWSGTIAGLDTVNGSRPNDEKNPTRTMHEPVKPGQKLKVQISVRVDGTEAEFRGAVDGIPPIQWKGPITQLGRSSYSQTIPADRFGVMAFWSQWTVHSLRFKKIDGTAEIIKQVLQEEK